MQIAEEGQYLDRLHNTVRTLEIAHASKLFETVRVNALAANNPDVAQTASIMAEYAATNAALSHSLDRPLTINYGAPIIDPNQSHVYSALLAIENELSQPNTASNFGTLLTERDYPKPRNVWNGPEEFGILRSGSRIPKKLRDLYAIAGIKDPDQAREQARSVYSDPNGDSGFVFTTNLGVDLKQMEIHQNTGDSWLRNKSYEVRLFARKTRVPQPVTA